MRRVSLTMARMYGRSCSSSKLGDRDDPTTRSSSACAAARTAGFAARYKNAVLRAAEVVSLPASIMLPARKAACRSVIPCAA